MKCQQCGTTRVERFGASVLICDRCLAKKQIQAEVQSALQLHKMKLGLAIDNAVLFGLPLVMDDAERDEHVTYTCTTWIAPSDPIKATCDARLEMCEALFKLSMERPIQIRADAVCRACEDEFGSTAPRFENVILPLSLSE